MTSDIVLDQTVPADIRGVITITEQATATVSTVQVTEEETMSTPNAATPVNEEAIKAAANTLAADILAKANNQKELAQTIAGITTDRETAKASLAKVEADLATATVTVADLTKKLADQAQAVADKDSKIAKIEADLATANKQIADTTKAATEANEKLAAIETQKAVATRTEKLTKLGLKAERIAKAVACNEKGQFVIGNDEFDRMVDMVSSIATVAPVAAPVAQANASVPAEPVIQTGGEFQRAVAGVGAQTAPTQSGREMFAQIGMSK